MLQYFYVHIHINAVKKSACTNSLWFNYKIANEKYLLESKGSFHSLGVSGGELFF
jgi:hypothetical protein